MTWHKKGCAEWSQSLLGIECLSQCVNLKLLFPTETFLFSPYTL